MYLFTFQLLMDVSQKAWIGSQCQTHHTAGEADAPQPRADVVPHTDAAPTDPLSHGKLQEEKRDADQYQQDEIGHQVRSYQPKQCRQHVRWRTRREGQQCHQATVRGNHFSSWRCHMQPHTRTHTLVNTQTPAFLYLSICHVVTAVQTHTHEHSSLLNFNYSCLTSPWWWHICQKAHKNTQQPL